MDKKTKTILVVEDDKALNQAVVLKLNKKGYNPISVFTAEEAMKVLEASADKIDFIWLDILLPGMSGLDFLKLVRENQNQKIKDKKVAIVSVSGGYEKQKEAKDLGVVDYIIKSNYNLNDIIEMVSKDIDINNK